MRSIIVLAKNTFKEAIRDRVLAGLVIFGALFILADLFVAQIALGDLVIIKSFGLAGMYLFGMTTTIFLGASIIHKEIERKTLYFVLAKPVTRRDVILGKFFGLLAAVSLATLLMAVVYGAVVFAHGGLRWSDFLAVAYQLMEQMLFVALMVFFSSIVSPLLSNICSIAMLFIGHVTGSALQSAQMIGGTSLWFIQMAYYLLPNLEKFNIRNEIVHQIAIPPEAVLISFAYALVYSAFLLYGAIFFFEKREL